MTTYLINGGYAGVSFDTYIIYAIKMIAFNKNGSQQYVGKGNLCPITLHIN